MKTKKIPVIIICTAIIVAGCVYALMYHSAVSGTVPTLVVTAATPTPMLQEATQAIETVSPICPVPTTAPVIYVHVCGEVCTPGVYCMLPDARVIDCILAAGGFTVDAAQDYVNQAAAVTDGSRCYIPSMTEAEQMPLPELLTEHMTSNSHDNTVNGIAKVSVNTASAEELATLPGIGSVKAARIVTYRETNGPFLTVEELSEVEGISNSMAMNLEPYVIIP